MPTQMIDVERRPRPEENRVSRKTFLKLFWKCCNTHIGIHTVHTYNVYAYAYTPHTHTPY